MTVNNVKELLHRIDINYQTNFSRERETLDEWYKDLKNYDYFDVDKALDNHMKYSPYRNIAPKKWVLLQELRTIKQKESIKNIEEVCPFCLRNIKEEKFEKHYSRCLSIDFIDRNVKKYLNKKINYEKYFNMSEKELNDYFNKIAKIVYEKTKNPTEKFCLERYLKNV